VISQYNIRYGPVRRVQICRGKALSKQSGTRFPGAEKLFNLQSALGESTKDLAMASPYWQDKSEHQKSNVGTWGISGKKYFQSFPTAARKKGRQRKRPGISVPERKGSWKGGQVERFPFLKKKFRLIRRSTNTSVGQTIRPASGEVGTQGADPEWKRGGIFSQ